MHVCYVILPTVQVAPAIISARNAFRDVFSCLMLVSLVLWTIVCHVHLIISVLAARRATVSIVHLPAISALLVVVLVLLASVINQSAEIVQFY